MNKLFDSLLRISLIRWQKVLEDFRLARSLLRRVTLLVLDGLTKEACISIHLFLVQVYRLGRRSGWLYCALYLKQCSTSLQLAYGGGDPHESQSVPVSLNRSGYPRILPPHHRRAMYLHDERADTLVHLYLTFFSFYRIIEIGKRPAHRSVCCSVKRYS